MSEVRSFRDLRVYSTAFEAAMEIFEITKRFPSEERYSLTDQIRRASRSVAANIAEGWRKRTYPAAFVSKLSDSATEATETLVWLDFALRCGYLPQEDHARLTDRYDHINAQLFKMTERPEEWCTSRPTPRARV